MPVWVTYWKLARDPFTVAGYVATPTHDEAVARLVHAIETGQRTASLRAAAGLGKSTVLARALAETRAPYRRTGRAVGPFDGASLFAALAEGLGSRLPGSPSRAAAWRALAHAVRLERWQKSQVVLVVDDVHQLGAPADLADLERLVHLDPSPAARVTILTVGRPADEPPPVWDVQLRLPPLTREETERFVTAKLTAAGRSEPTFTQRALTRLHARAGGVPRGLDRLSQLALMAGAVRGVEIVTPELVDGVAHECVLPAA